MKKLLILGGLRYLIPIIKTAQEMGHHVITCDFVPSSIAHQYSDEYHNESIVDKEAILDLAIKLKIDGIMSFAVDPGVTTAAYVAEKMNLPSPGSLNSINILQNKGLFRAFLEKHNFNVPKSKTYSDFITAKEDLDFFNLPVIIKPVDSAGSKGVSKIESIEELHDKVNIALKFSSSKEFIIEEFIEQEGYSSDSDCFSVDGKLIYCSFSNQRFDKKATNPYTPSAYSWPSSISSENKNILHKDLQRLIGLLNMKTSIYNIEVRVGKDGLPYIMEVSPRGGGNRLSEVLKLSTGVDLIDNTIRAALGIPTLKFPEKIEYNNHWAEQILYSPIDGVFQNIEIDQEFEKKYVHELDLWVSKGDQVAGFSGANQAIGTLILKFNNLEDLENNLKDMDQFVKINII